MFFKPDISIPLAILITLLVFGLARYYSQSVPPRDYRQPYSTKGITENKESTGSKSIYLSPETTFSTSISLFIAIYAIALAICAFSNIDLGIFISWKEIGPIGIIQLGSSIMLAFFLPGYALISTISKSQRIEPILKVIIGYLFSILITGLVTYILAAYFGASASLIKDSLIAVYFILLVILSVSYYSTKVQKIRLNSLLDIFGKNIFSTVSAKQSTLHAIKERKYELVVFGSLFGLLIVSTYYTYGGITLGDQWFHQGRAFMILSGSFRDLALSRLDSADDPSFQSAIIAGVTAVSGIPLVNTYASIAFLNIISLFSFYYFFTRWVPAKMQRAKMIASALFTICSGFGWIYLISLASTTNPIVSEHSSLETIFSTKSYVLMPSNFIIASHPDFNTSLIYIAIPAGLVLLGLARQIPKNKKTFFIVVTTITILGVLSHDEYYFFIIIASIIPVIFRIKYGNYLYLSLLVALFVIYLINVVSPKNYYTLNQILGFPLLFLNIFFVVITWSLYFMLQKVPKPLRFVSRIKLKLVLSQKRSIGRLTNVGYRTRFIMRWFIISVVAFVYLASFIILSPLSLKDVNDEASHGAVPWYQYPMKLGVAGLLGLAFILSYIFKRFDKEIFIFGLIILIALITSPYYDQHRFSKYIMLGAIGLASMLVYKILEFKSKPRAIINGIIIMTIIITGSLSTLLFVGYNSLAFQNHDYVHDLGRRNFPTESEFHLMEALRNSTSIDSSRYNVISTPDEYNFYKGTMITKLSAFAGYPTGKLLQGRFVLNVSNLDSLYRILDYTNTRFIVIPKESIKHEETKLSESVRFALDNFQHYYENEKYVVLDVPPLAAPSSSPENDVAFVYSGNDNLLPQSAFINTTLLQYNNATFNSNQLKQLVFLNNTQEINSNESQNTIVCSTKVSKGLTVWSKGLDDIVGSGINYAEMAFRIVDSPDDSKWNDAGIKWNEANKQYYASISKNGLELYQKTIGNASKGESDKKLIYQNSEVQRKDNVWYNLKIDSLPNSVNVYVDGSLKGKFPRSQSDNTLSNISSVAVSCFNNDVEFTPIEIGKIKSRQNDSMGENKNNYEHFYPLSILALSKSQYDSFRDKDLSALSKKVIILSFDPSNWDDTIFNHYLDYVNQGGTLVVINSDGNLKGRFSQLLSLKSNENASKIKFTNIMGTKNEDDVLNFSGMVKNVQIDPSSNTSTIASYVDNANKNANNAVAPFALEKLYPNRGKIIVVNAGGYFDAISKSPTQYFMSLSNVSSILGLQIPKSPSQLTTLPTEQFVGSLDVSGNTRLKSTSLLIANNADENNEYGYGNSSNYNINAQSISIYKNKKLDSTFNNVSISDLKLIGDYKVIINSKDHLQLPYMTSQHDYIGVLMPSKFNMTIQLSKKPPSFAEIVIHNQKNQTSINIIKVNRGSVIQFYNVQTKFLPQDPSSVSRSTFTPILLKSPEVEVNGSARFTMLRFTWHFLENIKFDLQGLNTRLNFVDDYSELYGNGTRIKYITFMNSTTKF